MNHTLSVLQWQKLEAAFAAATPLESDAQNVLVAKTADDDALVGEALVAMLRTHQQWRLRTGDAKRSLSRTMQVSAVGDALGAYRLVDEIGRGGMGVVYRGERMDGHVQQEVAIKVLHRHALDDNTRARFQREREILAGFDHPGIARLLDAGESAAGEPYFVMEYLRGKPLLVHCDEQRLGLRERLRLFLDVCAAAQYAHGRLVLHRDIKPGNIIVDSAGLPRLIDFGIAKQLDASVIRAEEETAHAQRYFSPVNAAPEQVRGDRVAVTCDVYQLGTVLYELLSGAAVFDLKGKTAAQIEAVICEHLPKSPSAAAAGDQAARSRRVASSQVLARALRGDLDAIVLRALRKEPASRYASVEQFADDVLRHLEQRPVLGRRGTFHYRTRLFLRRNWRSVTLAVLGIASASAFTLIVIGERDKAIVERGHAEAATQFLVEMFRSGVATEASGLDMPVRVALQRGESRIDQNTTLDLDTRLKLLRALGAINIALSDLGAAGRLMDKAVELARASGAEKQLLADTLLEASNVHFMREEPDIYGPLAKEAAATFDAMGIPPAASWYAHLQTLRWQLPKDRSGACAGIEQLLLDVRNAGDQFDGLAVVLRDMVRCRDKSAATLARTERELRESIALLARHFGAGHARVLDLQLRHARVLRDQRRYDEAVDLLQSILKQYTDIFGEKSWGVAYAETELGGIAFLRKRYDEAESYLLHAHEQYTRMHRGGPNSDYCASAFALAQLYDVSGRDVAKARAYYDAALQTASSSTGPTEWEVGRYSAAYGAMLARIGDNARAEELLRTAVANLPLTHTDG
ncbi:MAG: serine/threonine-protein kinase, partial [Tahibacter sp.]